MTSTKGIPHNMSCYKYGYGSGMCGCGGGHCAVDNSRSAPARPTTTESHITSGKAESIDNPEFRRLLWNFAHTTGSVEHINALIAHIEAVREKDREEARKEEEEATDDWRRLALQFDCHRMQALGHLKAMLQDPTVHRANAEQFLAAGPLSGEVVLAERIAALAARQAPDLAKLERYNCSKDWMRLEKEGQFVRFDDVAALLSPAQQEPAKTEGCAGFQGKPVSTCGPCEGKGCDFEAASASATDAWQAKVRAGYAHCNCDPNVTKYCDGNCYDPALAKPEGGIPREGCNYLWFAGSVCNKCGKVHKEADSATDAGRPIPAGITFSEEHDNFYNAAGEGMGEVFYLTWRGRRNEFPSTEFAATPAQATLDSPSIPVPPGLGREQTRAFILSRAAQATPSLPSTPDEVIAFIGSNFASSHTQGDKADWRYQVSVHDLLSAFSEWQDFPVAQATPEGGQELPPLPAPDEYCAKKGIYAFGPKQMRDYARAALAATQQAAELPDWLSFDAQTMTIFGIRYALDLFRDFGSVMPQGTLFKLVKRECGTLTISRVGAAAEPVHQMASRDGHAWTDIDRYAFDVWLQGGGDQSRVRVLYRAAPPQQVGESGLPG